MTGRPARIVLALCALAAGHGLLAQTATGRITGVIVDAQTRPQPVHRAIVTLSATELPAGRATVSDDEGRFSFEQLPAGRFTLSASKPAYLKMAYGAMRPGGAGTPITLAADQQITNVKMTLPHGSAIAGVIRDLKGDPIPGIQVSAVPISVPSARPVLRSDAATTDDRGAYRLFGLVPGNYLVAASPASSGGLGEVGIMSSADVDAAFARLRQGGAGPAGANASARPSSPSSIVRPTRPFSTTPIFFPGVPSVNAATQITLGVGEERNDVDFAYQLARSAAVSGTVTGANSPSTAISVTLTPDTPFVVPLTFGAGPMLQQRGGIGTDGAFTFANVTPGTYTLLARGGGPAPTARGGASAAPATPVVFAMTSVEVTGEDISGLSLTLQPAPHVAGRLVLVPTSTTPPADLTKLAVQLVNTSGVNSPTMQFGLTPTAMVIAGGLRADGTFDITGVLPGSYRLKPIEPTGWRSRSAALGDKDLLDVALEVGTSDVGGIIVTLTDTHSQIAGRLLQGGGTPVSRYFVVAFPADRAQWVPQSRRMKSARPATDGQFHLDDLPAGDYYLAAITDGDQDEWQSAEFLAQALTGAVKITLGDGEKKTQDLRIGG